MRKKTSAPHPAGNITGFLRVVPQLEPQVANVHVHRGGAAGVPLRLPEQVSQHGPCEHLARFFRHGQEEVKLRQGQVDSFLPTENGLAFWKDHKVVSLHALRSQLRLLGMEQREPPRLHVNHQPCGKGSADQPVRH